MSGTATHDPLLLALEGRPMDEAEAEHALRRLASGEVDPAAAGALLVAMRLRGETVEEIRGFARGMRALAVRPDLPHELHRSAVDIVGTGGDGSGSLNLSTGAALLAAAAGVPVVKHGNRSITSRCGSADVLEELGLPVPLDPRDAGRCLQQTGFTFLFAPSYHPAMRRIGPVRKALGIRTLFNVLGPLTNPAAPPFHVIGAWSEDVAERLAHSLAGLPIERAFVLHGAPGWDEATPCGPYTLFDVRPGAVRRDVRDPADVGIERCRPEELLGGDAPANAEALRSALTGEPGAHGRALVLGAALALEVTGTARTAPDAVARARAAIDDGSAGALLEAIERFGRAGEAKAESPGEARHG